jgi:hypothetical protein
MVSLIETCTGENFETSTVSFDLHPFSVIPVTINAPGLGAIIFGVVSDVFHKYFEFAVKKDVIG